VQNHDNTANAETPVLTEPTEPITARPAWHAEIGELLMRAGALCVQHGADLESFMHAAWSAYVECRPGMREHLEEMQLRDQLDEIRKLGKMAEA
jgi:hypothetical protein